MEEGKELEAGQIILIPTEDVPLEKFVIPKDYIEMLKNNTFPAKSFNISHNSFSILLLR